MPDFSFLLLHVENHGASATFYNDLLGIPIIEQKPDFSMLPLSPSVMLGLWARGDVEPKSTGQTGASEVAFTASDKAAVEAMHVDWSARGVTIIQTPSQMSFGTTFVALDPDGHRLRVFAPGA
jgi:predicted enzyme related to lactoylglutathione lyase